MSVIGSPTDRRSRLSAWTRQLCARVAGAATEISTQRRPQDLALRRVAGADVGRNAAGTSDRAASAAVADAADVEIQWRPLGEIGDIADVWRALAARALVPNVFYEPAFACAAAPVFGARVLAALVWSRSDRRLVGLWPMRIERARYGALVPVLAGWTHPYAPLGVPLLDRDCAATVLTAILQDIATSAALPKVVLLPLVPRDGPFAAALAAATGPCGVKAFGDHARALLAPGSARVGYLERTVGGKKRKELRRQRRRLADAGPLAFDTARTGERLAESLRAFLALETGGWKGKAGGAAHARPEVARFVERALAALGAEHKATAATLSLDGAPIAAALALRSGDTAWFWKIAYDENLARHSPGVQLALDLSEAWLADPTIARVDSCAVPGHPMIDGLWGERLPLADLLIGATTGPSFRIACARETLRRFARRAVRRVLRRR